MAWQDLAACRGRDPNEFVVEPTGVQKQTTELHAKALKTCQECDVTTECLHFALTHDERLGVWGCTTPRERRRLKKAMLEGKVRFTFDPDGRMVMEHDLSQV